MKRGGERAREFLSGPGYSGPTLELATNLRDLDAGGTNVAGLKGSVAKTRARRAATGCSNCIGNSPAPVNRVRARGVGGGHRDGGDRRCGCVEGCGPERGERTGASARARTHALRSQRLSGFFFSNGSSGRPDQCVAADWLREDVRRRRRRCFRAVAFRSCRAAV